LMTVRGLEQLAAMAARAFCRTLCHLTLTDPTSSVLTDLRRRYNKALPPGTDFSSVPFNCTMVLTQVFISRPWNPKNIEWHNHTFHLHDRWWRLPKRNIKKRRVERYLVGSSALHLIPCPRIPHPQHLLLPTVCRSSQLTLVVQLLFTRGVCYSDGHLPF
jgi:hypothetical protein